MSTAEGLEADRVLAPERLTQSPTAVWEGR